MFRQVANTLARASAHMHTCTPTAATAAAAAFTAPGASAAVRAAAATTAAVRLPHGSRRMSTSTRTSSTRGGSSASTGATTEPPAVRPTTKDLIITMSGPNRWGFIRDFARVTSQHGADWAESRSVKMGTKFSIIAHICLPDANFWSFFAQMNREFRDVKVSYTALADADVDLKPREKLYYTTITGPNREGVVNDLTNYLAGSNIDVVEAQTDTYRAPMSGAKMFKLHVTCSIPTEMDENTETGCTISKEFFDNVNEGLQDLGDALGFEVETLQLDEGVFGLYRR